MSKEKAQGLPANLIGMLAEADKRNGFPPGTMQSIVKQEVGAKFGDYLADPAKYHYGLNAEGRRVAGHTGKVSTAFGPFGILESTGKDPGYGVKPLADKSLGEQVRFASEYLAARSKRAGGLAAGLAGYGEGAKYSGQVMARLGTQAAPEPQPVMAMAAMPPMASAGAPVPVPASLGGPMPLPPELLAALSPKGGGMPAPQPSGPDPWSAFLQGMAKGRPREKPVNLDFGVPQVATALRPEPVVNRRPNFEAFGSWTGRAA
jgi:hypothetical protein